MDAKEIRAAFEEHGIRRVKLGGFDVDGVLRGKLVSLDKFWSAVDKGFGFCDVVFGWDIGDVLYDNAKVTGWHTGYPDILAKIDLESFRVLPGEPGTAAFLVDFCTHEGKPHPACPRSLLARVDARARTAGFRARFAAEFEFWIFRESAESLRDKGFRGLRPLSPGMFGYSWVKESENAELLHAILEHMEKLGIRIEGLHTETGPGVYEAAIVHEEVLLAADQAALFKTELKSLCARRGLAVTFMAKWNAQLPGSSGHLHQSLWDSDMSQPLFYEAGAEHGLSRIARHYIGGLVKLAPELTALFAPTVNSYKRYVPGVWAPLTATWGVENRTCAVRVITGPGKSATRAEFRQTAADIQPHIAMAACLGAGLHGIERAIDPPSAASGDASAVDPSRTPIPTSLLDATRLLASSEAAREILGEPFVDHYVRTRDWEWRQYAKSVSDWELARYFEST